MYARRCADPLVRALTFTKMCLQSKTSLAGKRRMILPTNKHVLEAGPPVALLRCSYEGADVSL